MSGALSIERWPVVARPASRPVPRVGVVTNDPFLVQRLAGAVARHAGVLSVAETLAEARELLRAPDFVAKVIDYRAADLVPASSSDCAHCVALRSVIADDGIAMMGVSGGVLEPCMVRGNVYHRRALDLLVEDLGRLIVASGAGAASDVILGESPVIQLVREQVRSVARYHDIAVLVLGETGSGKELVAQAIHDVGGSERPFVAINCAAIPDNLFESELFGHEAGAYTGARGTRVGLLEGAANGTVFLDEIGEMPGHVQAKLLRVLETRTFRRVGSNRDVRLTARIISATNRGTGGSDGTLRTDLLYRLAGFTISLPSLRERAVDVPLLARAFLAAFIERHRVESKHFDEEALSLLSLQSWPGNVRELKAVVEYVAILATNAIVSGDDVRLALARIPRQARVEVNLAESGEFNGAATGIRPRLRESGGEVAPSPSSSNPPAVGSKPPTGLRSIERDLIVRTFEECERNLSLTARQLQIPRTTLRDKLRRYGLL
jgi:DNA-binding NtrC family response regulator